ncbi:MAG TPA: DNA-formamidopyrimidine glycosylase [Chloroflexota bacterium]|nr:DNA-formamidopyrimidine glycosylase [Chloroflexota bacterium]
MPELPEVETTRRTLAPHLIGRAFTGVLLEWPKAIAYPDPATFAQRLSGRRIVDLERRGKHLILVLDDGSRLVVHLRMTGSLQLAAPTAAPTRFTRNTLLLDDGTELRFVDLRKFGQLWLVGPDEPEQLPFSRTGPEPLDPDFTGQALADLLCHRHGKLKATLLDQHVLAGLGNIYVDEALFEAGLHPERSVDSLTDDDIARLHGAIVAVLRRGIHNQGTSYRDFVGPFGEPGSNQEDLRVWRRGGQACPRCGTPIQKLRVAGRGTHLCPSCQRVGG